MQMRMRMLILVAAPAMLSACATKGWVRKEMAANRAYTDTAVMNATAQWNAQLAMEHNARVAADSMLAVRMDARDAELRAAIEQLRSQFNAKVAMMEGALTFALPVTFAFDDATVRDENRAMVERFAQVAQRFYPRSVITVEGFADPAGSMAHNLDLSRRRAENVRTMLGSMGVAESQVRAVGYGSRRQVVQGAKRDDPGAEENRRVTFVIESAGRTAVAALQTPKE